MQIYGRSSNSQYGEITFVREVRGIFNENITTTYFGSFVLLGFRNYPKR